MRNVVITPHMSGRSELTRERWMATYLDNLGRFARGDAFVNVVDKQAQEKIDVVKQRLIRDYGYDDQSATDVLTYVASIFARGEMKAD